MKQSEINEISRFFFNEDNRLENLFVIKWNNIFAMRKFDTLDLLDLIELSVQMDYLNYIQHRVRKITEYMKEIY